MRKHQAVDAGYSGDQDDDEAMGLVDTDAIQNGSILEAESHTVAVQIEVQWLLHQLQDIMGCPPEKS